jgi:tetratricopeptide (TPR) repeat protein
MNHRTFVAALSAVLALAPAAALAQPSSIFEEPKLLKLGTSTTPAAGKGSVVVQVFVNADGSAKVQRIIKSSNPGDDKAATEIAASSKYKAATNHGQPVAAFKDFTLNFSGTGATVEGGGSEIDSMDAMIRAGNYSGAKNAANNYLAGHAGDASAYAILGAADGFLNDSAGAAAAFDKAGTIPDKYKPLAAQAYQANANSLASEKKYDAAVTEAKKAVALAPSISSYNALGVSELSAGDSAAGVRDLEQANKLGAADAKVPAGVRAQVLGNLAAAYAADGQMDKAKSAVAQAKALDPGTKAGDGVAATLANRGDQEQTAKKYTEAAADFSTAAEMSPANAGNLYTRAAFAQLSAPKPDNAAARDAAGKALAADPNNAAANFALGVAYANDGKRDDAKTALDKALAQAKAANQTALADKIQEALKQIGGAH